MRSPAARYRQAKCARNQAATRYLRAVCDPLWRAPFDAAKREIEWAAQTGAMWLTVKIPFPFDAEMQRSYEGVLERASAHGFERRPGGQSGLAFDMVFLERTS